MKLLPVLPCLLAALAALFSAGCQAGNETIERAPSPVPVATLEPGKSDLETDIRDMWTAGLGNVFVLRRKDGKEFDSEDRQFLRDSMPAEMNRRLSADGGKAFVLGTSFIVPKETVKKWRERFSVEEKTSPEAPAPKKK